MEIIEKLASTLKKHKSVVYNILPITTAKVPIVKFKHARTQLEGDISLYNTLVSDMLETVICFWLSVAWVHDILMQYILTVVSELLKSKICLVIHLRYSGDDILSNLLANVASVVVFIFTLL